MNAAQEVRSVCAYCGVGCGVIVSHDGARITGVRGDPEHPANFGRLCSKGRTLHLTAAPHLQRQVRRLEPLRRTRRGAPLQALRWDEAQEQLATRLAATVSAHGPDSVGLYLSGQLLTEDYHVFNKLGRALIGTNNVDSNSRLCMSSAVAGYKASLGADAVPCSYADLELARTVFITGSNMAWAHPVLMRRLEDARAAGPKRRWIVVDPRRTETAAAADLHLRIQPGTDVVLHHALLHVMLWEDLADRRFIAEHTRGFDALRDRVREFTPAHAARLCGVKAEDIVTAARWFAGLDGGDDSGSADAAGARLPTLSLYCQGLNQSSSGTDRNTTLINLHLACGQIGRPGAGPLSLTGQPNAMGGREVGALAPLLAGHREVADAGHRAEVAALWGMKSLPAAPGLSAVRMFEAAADGALRLLWIVCTNPAHSLPDQALVRRALERTEFVVLQEAFAGTATEAYADLVLPATTWGEKDGTLTNSERRISRVRAALLPPGQARADWQIAAQVAQRLEALLPSRRVAALDGASMFDFADAEAVWNEHREGTRGRDLDITGLSWRSLETPQQWPFPSGDSTGSPGDSTGRERLYEDLRFATPDGRARFHAPAWRPPAERCSAAFPVALTTGRLRDQWHGGSRSGLLARLFAHAPEPALQMHPQDLALRQWSDGELLRIRSRSGELVLPVQASDSVSPQQAFIAMHWGSEWVSGGHGAGVNALLPRALCPQSEQPELKHAAVAVERAALPWTLTAAAWFGPGDWAACRDALRSTFGAFGFASCVPFGREADDGTPQPMGLLLRAAAAAPPAGAVLQRVQEALALADGPLLCYEDERRAERRVLRLDGQARLGGFLLTGDTRAFGWLFELLRQGASAAPLRRALLAAAPQALQTLTPGRTTVCTCHDVDEAQIVRTLAELDGSPAARLGELQRRLRCGSSCGSCRPALQSLAQRSCAASRALADESSH